MIGDLISGVWAPIPTAKQLQGHIYRRDADGMMEKRCSRCREYLPADTEFFTPASNGLHSHCKFCNCELHSNKKSN